LELPAQLEVTPAWREIRAQLRGLVGDTTYDVWLEPLELVSIDGNQLVLRGPAATQDWVASRFARVLAKAAQVVLGAEARVTFATASSLSRDDPPRGAKGRATELPIRIEALNPRYSFEQFVIGDANRMGHAAALAVAELPGQAYNPLFLHAPPGLGKTHLLHAIGNYVLAFGGGAKVRYSTSEAFTNNFISALGGRSLERFKRAYRDTDVLLIDDVQFLASKAKTEEEFFHTFNTLYENGRQLVLTCDRLPRQLLDVDQRLRERFEAGLVADMRPPDFATRVAILRKRAILDRVPLADLGVIELIAERVTNNVRLLEGALIRIVAYHSLTGRPIDLELATTVLDGMYPASAATSLGVADVQRAVSAHFELSGGELVSASRAAKVAWPRQIAIQLTREFTDASLTAIGQAFGGRNHATVLYACKKVAERIHNDPQAASDVEAISHRIRDQQADRRY
jgi:chromosomal replication initiator protein